MQLLHTVKRQQQVNLNNRGWLVSEHLGSLNRRSSAQAMPHQLQGEGCADELLLKLADPRMALNPVTLGGQRHLVLKELVTMTAEHNCFGA